MIRTNMTKCTWALSMLLLAVIEVPALAAQLPSTLMDPYLRIHVSLADDKMDAVADGANALHVEAQKLGAPAAKVAAAAAKLATAADLKTARAEFSDLSDALMAYAHATGATFGPNVNVVFCPMVRKSWLQKGTNVANPYFGKAMLTCGDIKK